MTSFTSYLTLYNLNHLYLNSFFVPLTCVCAFIFKLNDFLICNAHLSVSQTLTCKGCTEKERKSKGLWLLGQCFAMIALK